MSPRTKRNLSFDPIMSLSLSGSACLEKLDCSLSRLLFALPSFSSHLIKIMGKTSIWQHGWPSSYLHEMTSGFERDCSLLSPIIVISLQDAGLQEIMWVEQERNGLRQFLASFILLGYHLLLSFFIGSTECDLDLCKRILEEKLVKYPEGAFFLFFKGRYHFVQVCGIGSNAYQ